MSRGMNPNPRCPIDRPYLHFLVHSLFRQFLRANARCQGTTPFSPGQGHGNHAVHRDVGWGEAASVFRSGFIVLPWPMAS